MTFKHWTLALILSAALPQMALACGEDAHDDPHHPPVVATPDGD